MILLYLQLIFCILAQGQDDNLLVQTADGPLMGGRRHTNIGVQYRSYQGIPFAAPPTGTLRFAPPQPASGWTEVRDASKDLEIKCTQYGYLYEGEVKVGGSEDCLYLSVYSPANATLGDNLPVMFWIFGGYFNSGGNEWWSYGADTWIERDVIIVAPNHRLGTLGFTSLGIPEAPGNQGLLDLVAALKWVNVNIDQFGGDPDRVTIFGESSGSWACSYLHFSPHAQGLFHRIIMESGTLFNPYWEWRTEEDAVGLSTFMSTMFNCTDLSPYGQLDCLQKLERETIQDSINWGTEETLGIQKILRATGVVEGDFLPDIPTKLMERGEYNHVPIMIGVTKDEGLLQMAQFVINPDLYFYAALGWENLGPMFLLGKTGTWDRTPEEEEMVREITKFYLGPTGPLNINEEHFGNMTDMISDAYIWYGTHKHAEWAASNGDQVFQYQFNFKGPYGYLDSYGLEASEYGVAHSDELWFLWNTYFGKHWLNRTEEQVNISNNMLDMWVNFARSGDPTPPDSELPVTWEPVRPDSHQYIILDTEMKMTMDDYYVARMSTWDSIYRYPEGNTLPPQPYSLLGNVKVTDKKD